MRREVFDVGVKTLVQLNGDRYARGISVGPFGFLGIHIQWNIMDRNSTVVINWAVSWLVSLVKLL